MKEKIKELLKELKEKNPIEYQKANEIIAYLNEVRIKIIGNDLRKFLGRLMDDAQKDKILASIKELNNIAKKNEINFQISEDYGVIEKILRNTILEDIGNEFEKQNN